ncbi:MAG: hypothetical protein LBC88_07720 [Spirochaetaceae bacterium]|jgi:hypothetical protein|nr:hypothetical protein [Spirochaetaceae bacterium]
MELISKGDTGYEFFRDGDKYVLKHRGKVIKEGEGEDFAMHIQNMYGGALHPVEKNVDIEDDRLPESLRAELAERYETKIKG